MTDDTAPAPARPEARNPRGFQDRRARDLAAERAILTAVAAVYERYGFEALDTGAFEYADALGKFLPDADRPNEGGFALQDDDEQWMALRYDLTAPLARFAAQNWETLPKPFRRYAFGPVWRNEKPGPGRFREFTQCDADTVGSARPEADAEIIAMAVEGLTAAGLPQGAAAIKINNRKLLNGLLSTVGVTEEGQKLGVLRAVDKLDRLGPDGVRLLLGEGRKDESGAFTKGAGLSAKACEAVLAFTAAGGGTDRAGALDRIAAVIGGSAEGDAGLAELAAIDAALKTIRAPSSRPSCCSRRRTRRASRSASAPSAAAAATTTWWPASPARPCRPPASPSASRAWPRPCARRARTRRRRSAGPWWSSPSRRTTWPTTSPSRANCGRRASPPRSISDRRA